MKAAKRREVVAMLTLEGFTYEGDGKHPIYKCIQTGFRIPVPKGRDVSPGTLRDIIKLVNKAKALANSSDK